MWEYNNSNDNWELRKDKLLADDFYYLRQEIESVRFYSKCLSGATYIPINNMDNIYDIITFYNPKNWYISTTASVYSNTSIPIEYSIPIDENEYYNKYISEYGQTLKNLFTPERLIKDSVKNFIYVDVATTDSISDLNLININRVVDGIRLLEGHTVLIKDQKEREVLPNTTDPETYFKGSYTIIQTIGSNTEYEYFSNTNGIYKYTNNLLVKQNTLDTYDNCIRFSVSVKLGDSNKDKQFHLERLKNGYYPLNEPTEFIETKNWLLRNRVDYNNLLDINHYSILKHGTQSYYMRGITYSIPERTIIVGEFGTIINNQNGYSNVIRNNYKVNLRDISETSSYYWIIGDSGTILKVRKHDFNIENIAIIDTNLKSVSFFNDLNGVIVGELNTILVTSNGGDVWDILNIQSFTSYTYNKVLYKNINTFYVGGNNGVFIEFKKDIRGWTPYKRRISKFIDDEDEFLLVDNINDIYNTNINWGLTYSYSSTQSITNPKDLLFIVTDNNNIIIHDIDNSIPFYTDFMYLEFKNNYGDISKIIKRSTDNTFYFNGYDEINNKYGIFEFSIDYFSNIGIGNSFSNRLSTTYSATFMSDYSPNSMYDYNGEFLIAGNNSILKSATYGNTFSFYDIDSSFNNRLKSKLLFLDYDIASKLNFFTDDGEYRLPISTSFGLTLSNGFSFSFSEIINTTATPSFATQSEYNWFNYWRDTNATFEYYATQSQMTDITKVVYSNKFTYTGTSSYSKFNINRVTGTASYIINLAPSILDDNHSRFNGYGLTAISAPNDTSYDMYLYDYLMVLNYPGTFSVEVGDVLQLSSNKLTENFLVNKLETLNGYNFAYLYTDFNDSIIKDLTSSTNISINNLNKFSTENELNNNFNSHPISIGYALSITQSTIYIDAKFNNLTSYYNLASNVIAGTSSGVTYSLLYKDSFIKFGYSPTYNILDYLENINTTQYDFYYDKEYLAMPIYNGIPLSDGSTISNNCYIDYTISNNNKLIFGKNLKFEWNSIFLNTFIDIKLYDNSNYLTSGYELTEKLLVVKKYYDKDVDLYVIEFNKNLNYTLNNQLYFIDIISRRKLGEISNDLQIINNIQKNISTKDYISGTTQSGQIWNVSFNSFKNNINYKINTDSYAKILLSDNTTLSYLSGLIYTDYKNELSLNVTRLESEESIPILNTSNYLGNLYISCSNRHGLSNGDGVILEFTGGTGSSQELNNQYFGYQVVTIVNDYDFYTNVTFGVTPSVGNDIGFVNFIKKDPFLNYQPIDLIDVGIDKKTKISIELIPDNTKLSGNKYSLINIDYTKLRFRLIDNLDIESLSINYPWIYEAEIKDAVIGQDKNGLVWYKGKWECGRWFGGTWISGDWISGDWYSGIWQSKSIKDNYIKIEYDSKYSDNSKSIWRSGRWFGGTWNAGTWIQGRWYDGTWNNGIWNDGIWNDGIWNDGVFKGGIWILGDWYAGRFNTENAPSYWLDGNWYSGDFENGMWYTGVFDSKNGESRFGTKAYNSRAAIWHGGDWINGNFYSRLNVDNDGNYIISDIHKYSIWYTGNWFNGNFYGGVVYNIDFKSGIWYGGILEEIDIIGLSGSSTSSSNYLVLDGLYKFNIGDKINVIDNMLTTTYSTIGSNYSPIEYTVLNAIEDNETTSTKVYINQTIPYIVQYPSKTNLKLVSKFRNCNWKSGIWTNGIYENGIFEGGIWYNGIFNGTWG